MPTRTPPCHLHAILARDTLVGVIFRRDSSRWVQQILWNCDSDTFIEGQWFRGRIDDYGYDLSPDGRYLLYRAYKRQNRKLEYTDKNALLHWTAISRPPYFTALALWEHSGWDGGGFFASDQEISVNRDLTHPPTIPEAGKPIPEKMQIKQYSAGRDPYVYLFNARLHQHGWRETEVEVPAERDRGASDTVQQTPQHFVKGDGMGGRFQLTWSMFRWSHPAFGVHDRVNKTVVWLPADTEWADWDHKHRLVWAREGKVWAMTYPGSFAFGFADAKMLIDLSSNRPARILSPEWARQW